MLSKSNIKFLLPEPGNCDYALRDHVVIQRTYLYMYSCVSQTI